VAVVASLCKRSKDVVHGVQTSENETFVIGIEKDDFKRKPASGKRGNNF